MPDAATVIDDLAAEQAWLSGVLGWLHPSQWDVPTPAEGWAVRHQVAHLAEGEDLAALALTDPDGFTDRLVQLLGDLDAAAAAMAARAASLAPGDLLVWWDGGRHRVLDALGQWPEGERVGWVAGPMSVASFATARLMETFAHGWDVAEAVGVTVAPTPRLRHVAHLGVATRGFSFRNQGLAVPEPEPRVVLDGPGGPWTWGPADAAEQVSGPVLDFCLVVTQRRRRSRTALAATGPGVDAWLDIAQAFAGPPTRTAR